jgi:hypothetical protein
MKAWGEPTHNDKGNPWIHKKRTNAKEFVTFDISLAIGLQIVQKKEEFNWMYCHNSSESLIDFVSSSEIKASQIEHSYTEFTETHSSGDEVGTQHLANLGQQSHGSRQL